MDSRKVEVDLAQWIDRLRLFAKERNWEVFHSPKNLSMALSVEASELVEIFQWLNDQQSWDIMTQSDLKIAVEDEVADIMLYLLRFVDVLNIDLQSALENKIKKNALKYPSSPK